jgi:tetratricopeptide (TPR) repeat protein
MKQLPARLGKICLVIVCTSLLLSGYAQNKSIDSVNALIGNAASDTARINLINTKISILSAIKVDAAINLSKKNIEDSKKMNYAKGEVDARVRLARCYGIKGDFQAAEESLKIAEQLISTAKDPAGAAEVYSEYGKVFGMQSKYDSSILYFQKAIDVAEQSDDKQVLPSAYHSMAIAFFMLSNYQQSLKYFKMVLNSAEKQHDLDLQAKVTYNMGLDYWRAGDTTKAEASFLRALSLGERAGDTFIKSYVYFNLAELYYQDDKFDQSYDLAMKAAAFGADEHDSSLQSQSLLKAALSLAKQKKFSQAQKLNEQAMIIADSTKNALSIFLAYSNMGTIKKWQHKYKEAILYYVKAFHALTDADMGDEQTRVQSYLDLSESYERTGEYSKALQAYGKALEAYKRSNSMRDSMLVQESKGRITEITLNYETNKKMQLARVERDKENAVAAAKQSALVVALILTLAIAGISFAAFRGKQKATPCWNSKNRRYKQPCHS